MFMAWFSRKDPLQMRFLDPGTHEGTLVVGIIIQFETPNYLFYCALCKVL